MGKNGGILVRPAPAPAAPRAGSAGRAGRAGSEEVRAKPARPDPAATAAVGTPTMANFFASFFALGFQKGFSCEIDKKTVKVGNLNLNSNHQGICRAPFMR